MVEYFVPILVILAEAIMFIHVILRIMRCKKLSIKDTMIYPFMVITAFILLFFGVIKYINNDIADELYDKARNFNHPDDIFASLGDMGVKVVETCEGAEECEYEIQ